MKVAISGSRDANVNNKDEIEKALDGLKAEIPLLEILVGDCRGLDAITKDWADRNRVPVTVFEADWKAYGKGAGPIRNKEMVMKAQKLVVFPREGSKNKGSADATKHAVAKGIPVRRIMLAAV